MPEGEGLGQMVGPLPMGAWIAVVAIGLGLAYVARRRAPVAATSDTGGGGTPTLIIPPVTSTTTGTQPVTPSVTDNPTWYRNALSLLIGRNYDPVLADAALRDYLNGNTLTASEGPILQTALQLAGPPPNIPPGSPSPTPSPIGPNLNVTHTPYFKGTGGTMVDVATNPVGSGGWELDDRGGIHEFGGARRAHGGPYWSWPAAKRLTINANGKGGFVWDVLGAPHPFTIS